MSAATLLAYLVVVAAIAAVYKILTSSYGRIRIPGFEASWGK